MFKKCIDLDSNYANAYNCIGIAYNYQNKSK